MPTEKHNRGYARLPESVRRMTFSTMTQDDVAALQAVLASGRINPVVSASLQKMRVPACS